MTKVSKPLRIICILLSILLVLATVWMVADIASADIGGHVSVEYDTLNQDWLWVLNVDKQLTPWFKVGTTLGTYSEGFRFKHFVTV